MTAVVAVVALFSQLAAYVPEAALAGVLIFVGCRIFRLRDMLRIARYSRREINLVVAGALLVVVLPIQTGMLLAIMLSLAHGVMLVSSPPANATPAASGMWPPTMP